MMRYSWVLLADLLHVGYVISACDYLTWVSWLYKVEFNVSHNWSAVVEVC